MEQGLPLRSLLTFIGWGSMLRPVMTGASPGERGRLA